MTKEEILGMKAGRELDVLVAKEIFDIEVDWDYSPWDVDKVLPKQPFIKGEPRTVLGPMAHSVSNTIYEHSTDISAAWLVVEKMKAEPYFRLGGKFCDALVDMCPEGEELVFWLSPEAICKAALLAKLEVDK